MIVTLALLALDWGVLCLNEYGLLGYHSVYIAWLVFRLWAHKQPQSYCMRQEKSGEEGRKCEVCCALKPQRYYHCRRCGRCIYLMDHHCHWVGNCIGHYNAKLYLHLLANILLHSLIVMAIIVYNYADLFDTQQYKIYFLIDILPALYAIYQAQRLLHDLYLSVKNNQTLIQSYKNVHGEKTEPARLWEKYLGKNKISWIVPTFHSNQLCDLFQKVVYPKDEQVQEYDDPQDYIYGPSDQCSPQEEQPIPKQE